MKRGRAIILAVNGALIVLSIINALFHFLNNYLFALILLVVAGFSLLYFGLEKSEKHYNKDVFLNVVGTLLCYTVVTYLLGLWLGFLSNPLSLNPLTVLGRILPVIVIIIASELLRYIFISKAGKYRDVVIFTTVSLIMLNLTMMTNLVDFGNNYDVLEFVLLAMAAVSENIFFSYAAYKTDWRVPILYRLYMELPVYFVPIFPNLGDYVDTVIRFLMPVGLTYMTYRIAARQKPQEAVKTKNPKLRRNLLVGVFVLAVLIFVGITSGWFKYYTLVVGSGSMTPNVNKGDVIIVEKLSKDEIEELGEGEILVFRYDRKVIVHRIVEVGDGQFYTKGDANDDRDAYPVKMADVIGTTRFRMRLIGWPVVWLNEVLNR